jgi:hypothetical protein
MEDETITQRNIHQEMRRTNGTSMEGARLGTGAYSAAWEKEALSLPTDTTHQHPIQDPQTGEFYFMAGISPIGMAPLAPPPPPDED